MSYPFSADLQKQIQFRLASGGYSSEEDLLRDALLALDEEDVDLHAVREAIADWRAGDEGAPLKDAFNEIRASR